jgi:hypothetical protein
MKGYDFPGLWGYAFMRLPQVRNYGTLHRITDPPRPLPKWEGRKITLDILEPLRVPKYPSLLNLPPSR